MTEGGATRMKRNGARLFKNPPQPHMCIQDFIQVYLVTKELYVFQKLPMIPGFSMKFYQCIYNHIESSCN